MRILYFHQHFSTPQGATGTRSFEMAQKLIARGHQVTMVCGSYNIGATGIQTPFVNGKREGDVQGIHVIEFDLSYANNDGFLKRSWQFAKFALRSVSVALKRDYDLVFATSTPLTAAIPGIMAKVLRKKRFVFEVRDLWPELPKAMGVIKNPVVLWLLGRLEKAAYATADGCIGLSPGIVEGIKRKSRSSLPVALVPNGCDIELFSEAGDPFQLPMSRDDNPLIACFTGAHGMANGLHNVLNAASELKQRDDHSVLFVFVGEGKVKAELKLRAERENLDNCLFLDAMPKTQLVALMHQADVGLMTLANVPAFYYGTSPNKFFDYISCGLPVVNNYPGWLADMITEYDCGMAVPPDDPIALADALVALSANRAALPEKGNNARELASSRFDRNKLSDDFANLLEEVAAV